jgi:hypothetical protein
MLKIAMVLHRLLMHGADPGQSLLLEHVHWPRSSPAPLLHVWFVPHWLLLVHAGAKAQLPPLGGVELEPGPFWPMKIVCGQWLMNV